MKQFKSFSKKLARNNQGQGMVEYILLLVVVVAIVMAVKGQLSTYVQGTMMGNLTSALGNAMSTGN